MSRFTLEAHSLFHLLTWKRFRYQNEKDLQDAIETLLRGDQDRRFEREVSLGPSDRIDFLRGPVGGELSVGIEVKTKGAPSAVLQQLFRYAAYPRITELILITTSGKHAGMPEVLHQTPLSVIYLREQAF